KDAARNPLGASLRVGQRQRRSPRTAEEQPSVDSQVFAQPFDVIAELPGGARLHGAMRARSAAASLTAQDDPVAVPVDAVTRHRGAPCAGPAVEEQSGCALRVPGGLPANTVAVTDIEHSFRMRVDRRVENAFEVRMRG